MRFSLYALPFFALLSACSSSSDSLPPPEQSVWTSSVDGSGGGAASGGQSSSSAGGTPAALSTGGGGSGGAVISIGGSASGGLSSGGLSGEASGGEGMLSTGGDSNDGSGGASEEGVGGTPGDGSGGQAALEELAAGLHEFFMHDACTGVQQSQDDTCTHEQLIEESLVFGGEDDATYLVTLRIRGLFEPTNIGGGEAPLAEHPYFVVGGSVQAADYSQWQIEVQEPSEVYTLNHYPQTSHTIYQEDFEATIVVSGGSEITVRVVDANDRQIDNAAPNLPDRQQLIEDVTDEVLDGQVLRLDVLGVEIQE